MPANPSFAQSRASRLNGAQSNGPISHEGKQKAARNANQHGLRAEHFELRDDERSFATELRHGLAARVMPVDTAERAAVEALVVVEIKLRRLDRLEMRALDLALLDNGEDMPKRMPSLSTLDRYRGRLMRERRDIESRLEALKSARSQFVGEGEIKPEALRYLADLAERKAAEIAENLVSQAANDDLCTNEPKAPSAMARHGAVPSEMSQRHPGQADTN